MSDRPTLQDFAPVRANLDLLVPPAALVGPDVPPAGETDFLHADARPSDPAQAAIIAVIDHAIPFAHPLFTTSRGHSRFASIWLMEAAATERRADIAFGRELRGPDIHAMRVEGDPGAAYRACGLASPGRCMSMAHADSHGAAVAALAGGFWPSDDAGRQFPLLGVSLPQSAMAETSGSLAGFFIQSALVFIIARARALAREMSAGSGKQVNPALVVNLSLGVTAGPQDGSGPLARLLDDIGKMTFPELGRVHVVVPTGNHRQDCLRAHLESGDSIGWNIPPADPTPNAIEIWSAPTEPAPRLAIETPLGARLDVPLTRSGAGFIVDGNGRSIGRVVLQRRGGDGGRICQTVILHPTLPTGLGDPWSPPGLWRLRLDGAGASGCDLVIHRDDRLPGFRTQGRQSRLVDPTYVRRTDNGRWPGKDERSSMIRRNGTVSAYARGTRPIRVGAGLARPAGRISAYSGLLPDGLAGDVVALADASPARTGMIVPSITPAGRQRLSGTSLAAPQVARWLAAGLADGREIADRDDLRVAISDKCEDGTPSLPLSWPNELFSSTASPGQV